MALIGPTPPDAPKDSAKSPRSRPALDRPPGPLARGRVGFASLPGLPFAQPGPRRAWERRR